MKITLYQIVPELDNNYLIFRDLKYIRLACGNKIPAEIYRSVYCGELNIQTPEEAFAVFNITHPAGFRGRSMSVSDVVEFSSASTSSTFYFCDVIGCPEVEFDKSKAK